MNGYVVSITGEKIIDSNTTRQALWHKVYTSEETKESALGQAVIDFLNMNEAFSISLHVITEFELPLLPAASLPDTPPQESNKADQHVPGKPST